MVDSGMIQIEGLVPGGVTNMYKMPVQVYCFGAPDAGPEVRRLPVTVPGYYALCSINQIARRRRPCLSPFILRSVPVAHV